jgi:hypothetical protein
MRRDDSTQSAGTIKRRGSRSGRLPAERQEIGRNLRQEISSVSGSPQFLHGSSTLFPQAPDQPLATSVARSTIRRHSILMFVSKSCLLACIVWCLATTAHAAEDTTFFRLFLKDGSSVVSLGEFARLNDRVILSMPVGGAAEQLRIYVVTIPAARVDWERTDGYSTAVRSRWYADTRGEAEFQQLSSEVARVLNDVALLPDRRQGLLIAENARKALADWPRNHFAYRQADVREIVALLDESISDLRASLGMSSFDLALVADGVDERSLEPLLGAPTARDQIEQIFRVATLTGRVADRVGLLLAGLAYLDEVGTSFPAADAARWRREARAQIRREAEIDASYASLSRRVMSVVDRAASAANVLAVEKALDELRDQDQRLGGWRPETVDAVRASIQVQLEAARQLRLRRDQWVVRRALYSDYQRSVGSQLRQLVKVQSSLEAIRRLDGPSPKALKSLQKRLAGGADQLQRIGLGVPRDLREPHDLFVSAWRFAEKAVSTRSDAVSTGNLSTAWEASSAAAGSLLMLNRAQHDLRELVEAPKLQ